MRSLITAFFTCLVASCGYAQGTVIFNTRIPGVVDAPVFWFSEPAGPTVSAQLYLVSGEGNSRSYQGLTPAARFYNPLPEMPALAAYVAPPSQSVYVPGIEPGEEATLIMRVWEGGSYESAPLNAQSRPITVTLGGTNSLGEVFPEPHLVGLQGFSTLSLTAPPFPPSSSLVYFSREHEKLRFDIFFIDEWTNWPISPHNPTTRSYTIYSSSDLRTWQPRLSGATTQAVATVYLEGATNAVEFFLRP